MKESKKAEAPRTRTAREKLKGIVDADSFKELDKNLISMNILQFPEYDEKLKISKAKSFETKPPSAVLPPSTRSLVLF